MKQVSLLMVAILAVATGASCPSETEPEGPVTFDIAIQYDTLIQSSYTWDGHVVETREPTTAALTGTLVLDPLATRPNGNLTCISGCTGSATTLQHLNGHEAYPGVWRGDTLSISLYFDLMTHLGLVGVFEGDSIAGTAEQQHVTSVHTIYTGHFIAHRVR